jgi:hypothetical protein
MNSIFTVVKNLNYETIGFIVVNRLITIKVGKDKLEVYETENEGYEGTEYLRNNPCYFNFYDSDFKFLNQEKVDYFREINITSCYVVFYFTTDNEANNCVIHMDSTLRFRFILRSELEFIEDEDKGYYYINNGVMLSITLDELKKMAKKNGVNVDKMIKSNMLITYKELLETGFITV